MDAIIWDDLEIEQKNSAEGRSYLRDGVSHLSVTSITSKMEKADFFTWEKNVGTEKAAQIRTDSALHGSAAHFAIECYLRSERKIPEAFQAFYQGVGMKWINANPDVVRLPVAHQKFLGLLQPFRHFLEIVNPIAIEKKIFWSNGEVGFGGTADFFLELQEGRIKLPNGEKLGKTLVVADWKNFRSKKAPICHKWNGNPYYPLLKYALQLSAYCAGFNYLTNSKHNLDKAILVCATNSESPIPADLFYFSPQALAWHFSIFTEGMYCIKNNHPFDWIEYETLADEYQYLGEPVEISPAC